MLVEEALIAADCRTGPGILLEDGEGPERDMSPRMGKGIHRVSLMSGGGYVKRLARRGRR